MNPYQVDKETQLITYVMRLSVMIQIAHEKIHLVKCNWL